MIDRWHKAGGTSPERVLSICAETHGEQLGDHQVRFQKSLGHIWDRPALFWTFSPFAPFNMSALVGFWLVIFGQAEAVEFHDASGDLISFKLNGQCLRFFAT